MQNHNSRTERTNQNSEGLVLENQEWEQFKSEVKKQLLVSIKSLENEKERVSKYIAFLTRSIEENEAILERTKEIEAFSRVRDKMRATVEVTTKMDVALISMAEFLWIYETYYMHCVDWTCLLLTNNGHDLYDEYKKKYAVSLEDIGDVNVFVKLEFLKAHNVRMLIRKNDKDLRNSIAHHNFLLDEHGAIKVKGETIEVIKRSKDLLDFATKFWEYNTICFNECAIDIKSQIPPALPNS